MVSCLASHLAAAVAGWLPGLLVDSEAGWCVGWLTGVG